MNCPTPLRLKTYLLILVMILAGPMGNALLGKGMKQIGPTAAWPPEALVQLAMRILSSDAIWGGIGCLLCFFVAYMLVLSWADYSYVQPASSFSYAVVALLGYFMLGEQVSPLRWVGIGIICMGVFVVGRTNPQTSKPKRATPAEPA